MSLSNEDVEKVAQALRGEESVGAKLRKVATLGGAVQINKANAWLYGGNSNTTRKKLFGLSGPLHPGMPSTKAEMAVISTESDTSADLVRELMDKGLNREEARRTISDLLRDGVLREVFDPDLRQKVLVFRR